MASQKRRRRRRGAVGTAEQEEVDVGEWERGRRGLQWVSGVRSAERTRTEPGKIFRLSVANSDRPI
jgi:hypothetical protein